jgi:hypothetical protein
MKKTLINIWAYDHHAKFKIEHDEDTAESVEKVILDKLGEKSIVWENLGNSYHSGLNRITYEEVIDDTRPVPTKKVLELKWQQEHLDNNRYTLNMVRIDDTIKKVITDIKLEEARVAHYKTA